VFFEGNDAALIKRFFENNYTEIIEGDVATFSAFVDKFKLTDNAKKRKHN
jgi:hypothetical protein